MPHTCSGLVYYLRSRLPCQCPSVQGHSVFRTCACQSFPSPSTGEGEGGGAGRWRTQAMLLPPHPALPPPGGKGSKAQGGEGKIEN